MDPRALMGFLGGLGGGMPQQNMIPEDLRQDFKSVAQLAMIFNDYASSVLRPYGLDVSFTILGSELLEVMITEGDVKNVVLTREFHFPNPETYDPSAKEFIWIHEYLAMSKGNFVVHKLLEMRDDVFKVEVPITNPVYTPPHIDNEVDDEEQQATGGDDDYENVIENNSVDDIEPVVAQNAITDEVTAHA